jgi:hypothetical protein
MMFQDVKTIDTARKPKIRNHYVKNYPGHQFQSGFPGIGLRNGMPRLLEKYCQISAREIFIVDDQQIIGHNVRIRIDYKILAV